MHILGGGDVPGNQGPGPALPDWNDLEEIKCPKCEADTFIEMFKLRTVPAILTGAGIPAVAQMKRFVCAGCGHVLEEIGSTEAQDTGSESTKH